MKLHSTVYGEDNATPLILIHGLFGSGKLWRAYALQFAKHYQVHCPDLRNHGQSGHTNSMTYSEMAQDLLEYMDANQLSKAHVLGHSMGGKVAMQLAIDAPQRIDRLLIEDIAPMYYKPRHQSVFEAIDILDQHRYTSRTQADDLIKDVLTDKGLRLFLFTNLARQEDGSLDWQMNMQAIKANYDAISRAPHYKNTPYKGSTLFLKGADSQYILDEYRRKIREWFPLSRIHTIKNAGHWLHADQAETFVQICSKFLSDSNAEIASKESLSA